MQTDTKNITKFVVGNTAGYGTGLVVSQIIINNVPVTKIHQKVGVFVASIVIGSLASKAVRKESDRMIDEVALAIDQVKAGLNPTPNL